MPTNFLSTEQRRRFGHFTEDPDEGQLAGSFLLDQTARRRAMAARSARNRIGWAAARSAYDGSFRRTYPRPCRWTRRARPPNGLTETCRTTGR
ncbi:DUF4158 domain-containing protein [Streptomyces coeruleorubidus]|uniref:DUF4158 domain-containing protein n=1 Tax=Streptomyces coeruleorubidus TaxID=116188 RepID=UPI0033C3F730